MNPTSVYGVLRKEGIDFDAANRVDTYKRLDSSSIEMDLKSGAHGVFRIDPRTKKRYLILEWKAPAGM